MDSFDRLIIECDTSIAFFTEELKMLNSRYNNGEQLLSFNALITITLLDLYVILKNLCKAKTDWEKIFYIKHEYLVIHESIKKLRPDTGITNIQQIIDSKYPELKVQYHKIQDDIDLYKSRVEYKKIQDTRNFNAAHIESRFNKYYKTAFSLDGEEAAKLCVDYVTILEDANKIAIALKKDYIEKEIQKNTISPPPLL